MNKGLDKMGCDAIKFHLLMRVLLRRVVQPAVQDGKG